MVLRQRIAAGLLSRELFYYFFCNQPVTDLVVMARLAEGKKGQRIFLCFEYTADIDDWNLQRVYY